MVEEVELAFLEAADLAVVPPKQLCSFCAAISVFGFDSIEKTESWESSWGTDELDDCLTNTLK